MTFARIATRYSFSSTNAPPEEPLFPMALADVSIKSSDDPLALPWNPNRSLTDSRSWRFANEPEFALVIGYPMAVTVFPTRKSGLKERLDESVENMYKGLVPPVFLMDTGVAYCFRSDGFVAFSMAKSAFPESVLTMPLVSPLCRLVHSGDMNMNDIAWFVRAGDPDRILQDMP